MPRRSKPFPAFASLSLFAGFLSIASQVEAAPSYNRDVRPILSANCFTCHGPDEAERKAKTRLDIAGEADLEEVVARITSTDPDEVMPPPESNKSLKASQITTVTEWVEAGAPYEQHWAFVAPDRAAVQGKLESLRAAGGGAGTHPIDAFVDGKLREAGAPIAGPADPYTLIRRIYLDLIGLPPSVEEADAFAADPSGEAYRHIVEKLLASPRYGERWARRWLDLARYADTNGYEKDRDRSIWPYRDWVIRAINADTPFDKFTVEQLAGDMLPGATRGQRVATGFHRNTMLNEEGGIDPLEFRFHAMTDRVATTGTTWLGLTTGCAQCHTHKYDPITHTDYYGMMAYLNNADEPDYILRDAGAETTHRERLAEAERLLASLPEHWPADAGRSEFSGHVPEGVKTGGGSRATIQHDGRVIISGRAPASETYTITLETRLPELSALRLETLVHQGRGPGRTDHGNFVLSEIEVTAQPLDGSAPPEKVRLAHAEAEIEQPGFEVAKAIDGSLEGGWGIHDPQRPLNRDRAANFTFAQPVHYAGGARIEVKLIQGLGTKHTIGAFRLALGTPAGEGLRPSREELFEQAFQAWLEGEREHLQLWQTLTPSHLEANVPFMEHEGDGVIFVGGDTSKHDVLNLRFEPLQTEVAALRLEALPDDRLPDGGPGTTYYEGRKGDFYLTEFKVAGASVASATETFAKNRFGNNPVSARLASDGDIQTGWSIAERVNERHVAVFVFEEPLPRGAPIELEMHFGRHFASTLGKFRLSATATAEGAIASLRDPETDRLLAKATPSAGELATLKTAFLMGAPELAGQTKRIRELRQRPGGTSTLVMQERPASHPRPTYRHHRGEYTQPEETVSPRLPEALFRGAELPKDRLGFARWLVSDTNPLTARVVANRHWAAFFGTGIVATLEDFGMQGALPTHPGLLDHLALYLLDHDWSLKALHHHIVTSKTYQRSSLLTDKAAEPALLAHFPRQRIEAEIIRDSALRSAAILSEKMFGPPVRPPQPDGVVEVAYGGGKWNASSGEDRYRRSIYTYQKRTAPFAMFTTFDAGSGEACIARRDRSNTPLQALTLMNDPMFIDIAEKFGQSIAATDGDTDAKITAAFRRVLVRPPTNRELAKLRSFHAEHGNWGALARVLLSLDETVTKP